MEAKVLEVNRRKKQIKLSIKALQELPETMQAQHQVSNVVEEEQTKEPDLTAMEIALRSAMEKADTEEKNAKKKSRKNKDSDSEQEDLLHAHWRIKLVKIPDKRPSSSKMRTHI